MKSKSETIILVDMDDVMIDLVTHWVETLNKKYNTNVKPQDVTDWDISMFFPSISVEQVFEPLKQKEFWKSIKPVADAQQYLKTMWKEGYKIFVCTNTHWKNVKFKIKHVLLKYFDFIPWRNVIITSYKQMLKADYLIDDAVHNLRGGEYKKLLFSKPHNAKFNPADTDIVRVDNWKEIYNYISLSCV